MEKINMAIFFQKNGNRLLVKVMRKIYFLVVLRSNERRISFLRDAGAKIGHGVIIREIKSLGSEPYLIEIGDNTSFSTGVHIVTHDGSVDRTYHMGLAEKEYDCFGMVKIGKNCFLQLRIQQEKEL